MRILPTSGNRTFKVALRDYASNSFNYNFVLTNEFTKEETTQVIPRAISQIQCDMNQLEVKITDTFNNNDEYSFKILDGTNILHRGKILFRDE